MANPVLHIQVLDLSSGHRATCSRRQNKAYRKNLPEPHASPLCSTVATHSACPHCENTSESVSPGCTIRAAALALHRDHANNWMRRGCYGVSKGQCRARGGPCNCGGSDTARLISFNHGTSHIMTLRWPTAAEPVSTYSPIRLLPGRSRKCSFARQTA